MDIAMAGIDHSLAALDLRERFSFTKTLAAETMKMLKSTGGAAGCVILSTCNRTEFWLSGAGDADPAALLCELKGQSPELRQYLTVRRGEDAVRHLMQTACGMNSQLFGEDQIVTQVGDAGGLARECGGSDPILDTLFRMAVTAAKRVKTEVPLTEVRRSAAESALELLEKALGSLTGRSALVIGNGAMGQLTAERLLESGAEVTMTLRSFRSGDPSVPRGCRTVPYTQRFSAMETADMIVSATASPHFTIRREDVEQLSSRNRLFVDLAVPRDIDSSVAALPGAQLWDMDHLGAAAPGEKDAPAVKKAQEILNEYEKEYRSWYYFRETVPLVQEISRKAAEDLQKRMEKSLRSLGLSPEQRSRLEKELLHHGEKTVSHLLFGLRDTLEPRLMEQCLDALFRVD